MKTIHNILKNIKLTLILSVLVMLWSLESNASVYGILKGKVLDSDGKPAIGASVRVLGTSRGAKVKEDGEFTIVNMLWGKYNIIITYVGQEDYKTNININADQTTEMNVKMKLGNVSTKELIVTSTINLVNKTDRFRLLNFNYNFFCTPFINYKYIHLVDNFKEELQLIKYTKELRSNRLINTSEFIFFDKFNNKKDFEKNNFNLVVNDIQRYNPPTAKFCILENLSLNAGIVQ